MSRFFYITLHILFLLNPLKGVSQDTLQQKQDTLQLPQNYLLRTDTLSPFNDTLPQSADSLQLVQDSLPLLSDSGNVQHRHSSLLNFPITYKAEDSIIVNMRHSRETLIGNAQIQYQDIEITADYIEIDFKKNEVYAKGLPDSSGTIADYPSFKEGSEQFEATTIRYNFETKKGLIQEIITKQGDGFLHSEITKKHTDNVIDLKSGKYTTCNHEHPHFYIALTKARMIQDEKIVSGPLYLVIEDIPTPFIIPFGYFPFTKDRASGIIIPSYGDSNQKGLYLRDGGYYWAGTDYFDFKLLGSIYTKGSWDITASTRYKILYRFGGNIMYQYERVRMGEPGGSDEVNTTGYIFQWSHQQDPKANPFQQFGANVNMRNSASLDNSIQISNHINSTLSSDIAYNRSFVGTPFSLSANLKHTLNRGDSTVVLNFPVMRLNMNRITPFAAKNRVGRPKWYEKISFTYNADFNNSAKFKENLFLKPEMFDHFKYGLKHNASADVSLKFLKHFSLTPGVQYTERWYFDYINQTATDTTVIKDFSRIWDYSTSAAMSTTIYGFFNFHPKLPVEALRIVHEPSVSFSYRPDFGLPNYGYYDYSLSETNPYTPYSEGVFGIPSRGENNLISFALNNNVEMKVRTPKDTVNLTKKVSIFDNLQFRTSYNAAADTLKWSPLMVSGRTTLLKFLSLNFDMTLNWYALDAVSNRVINKSRYKVDGKIGRLTNASFSANFTLNSQTFASNNTSSTTPLMPTDYNYYYNYFDIPWSISVQYKYTYNKPDIKVIKNQGIALSGNVSVTKKWKVGFSSGYSFEHNKVTETRFQIDRDLHCMIMRFEWVPFGRLQSYMFTIGVKSSVLHDLKFDKREDFWDYAQ